MPFVHRHRALCGTRWRAHPRLARHGNQSRRESALCNPCGFERVGGLAGRKMADGEGRHVPGIVLEQERDALVVHNVAMLDAMSAEPDRILYRLRVSGMRHDLEAALPADLEGSADLVVEQE